MSEIIKDLFVDVHVSGPYAYVVDEWSGLRVIDVSTIVNPTVAGFSNAYQSVDVCVSGPCAYVAAGGLKVIDITDPETPRIVGSCATPGGTNGVCVSGKTFGKNGTKMKNGCLIIYKGWFYSK